jgi:uncharacterized membrane protein
MDYERYLELDLIRGFAISVMIIFHLLWDLEYYGISQLDRQFYHYGVYFPPIFFCLVGICLVISAHRKTKNQLLLRGFIIFLLGIGISILSYLIIPEKPVTFGVLHCIGLSIILCVFFLKYSWYNVFLAPVFFAGGYLVNMFPIENPTVIHLAVGLHQSSIYRYTVDYFPLLPWFGVFVLGLGIGNLLYKDGIRQFYFPEIHFKPIKAVSWMGKHSLYVYLAHQPIIAGVLVYLYPLVINL